MEPQATMGSLLWRVTTKWRTAVDRAVSPLGLTHAKYRLLASLFGLTRTGARPSQRELADFTGLEPIFVSKLARSLEQAGLLVRTVNPADPRAVQLALTEDGAATALRALAIVRDLQEELAAPIGGTTSGQARELVRTLGTMLGIEPVHGNGRTEMAQPVTLTSQVIAETQGALRALLDQVLSGTGVTSTEYVLMLVIARRGGMAAGELRDFLAGQRQLGLDPAGADALVTGLTARGFLQDADPVRLTPAGEAEQARLFETVAPITRQLYDAFEPEDLETVHRVLRQLGERADEMRKEL